MSAPDQAGSRRIYHIVIHCSATPNGDALFRMGDNPSKPQQTPANAIDAMHRARGFRRSEQWRKRQNPALTSIGYHFVISCNGAIFSGRHLDEIGAHVQGSNANSIGICLTGTDRYTLKQWQVLAKCVSALQQKFPRAKVVGHREFSPDLDGDGVIERHEWLKTCPGFDVATWLRSGMVPPADCLPEVRV